MNPRRWGAARHPESARAEKVRIPLTFASQASRSVARGVIDRDSVEALRV
jgi:hypothetical protein